MTTRRQLGLANVGEVYEIPFLRTPDREDEFFEGYESAALFAERARQRLDGWKITPENQPYLFRILKALQGHALGIELVAAGVVRRGLAEIADQLEKSLLQVQRTRASDLRDDAPRHESLEASLDWSAGMLSDFRLTSRRNALLRSRTSATNGWMNTATIRCLCAAGFSSGTDTSCCRLCGSTAGIGSGRSTRNMKTSLNTPSTS